MHVKNKYKGELPRVSYPPSLSSENKISRVYTLRAMVVQYPREMIKGESSRMEKRNYEAI